jgi:hypothetical protein
MRENLTEARLERIWRYSVLPYIAEQFYGETDRLEGFALDRLKKELKGEPVGLEEQADVRGEGDLVSKTDERAGADAEGGSSSPAEGVERPDPEA